MYVIVNIPDRCVEVYTKPMPDKARYDTVHTLRAGDTLRLPTATDATVDVGVDELFAKPKD